jgi:hypothetical protein
MTLENAIQNIKSCIEQMNALYQSAVFDEWVIASFEEKSLRILAYSGPRKESFQANLGKDFNALRSELQPAKHQAGDFEFARHASGTHFDAFIFLGEGQYLICNNTKQSMHEISQNPRWLGAQAPFAELAEKFRGNSLFHV